VATPGFTLKPHHADSSCGFNLQPLLSQRVPPASIWLQRVRYSRAEPWKGNFAMGKRTSHKDVGCPVARPLDAIGDWWSLLIIRDAFDGLRRFGEFQKNLGLAKNILSARLHNLVQHGIMDAVAASDGSPYQEYVLTEKGRGLFPLLVALRQWGEEFFFAPEESHVLLVDKKHGLPVRRLELRSQDGRVVGPEDTIVRGFGGN
jgi:DNA-binding HxlR family transcriptional regulator